MVNVKQPRIKTYQNTSLLLMIVKQPLRIETHPSARLFLHSTGNHGLARKNCAALHRHGHAVPGPRPPGKPASRLTGWCCWDITNDIHDQHVFVLPACVSERSFGDLSVYPTITNIVLHMDTVTKDPRLHRYTYNYDKIIIMYMPCLNALSYTYNYDKVWPLRVCTWWLSIHTSWASPRCSGSGSGKT